MRRFAYVVALILLFSFGNAQEINFINALAEKKTVSFEDGVKIYMYTLGKFPAGFDADVAYLKSIKLLKASRYDKDKPLRRGMLALMVARHLKLKSSLFFLIFDTERYAHRACVGEKIMAANTSELDTMSGDELLEVIARVSERMEEKK
ncbi:MAG TPA: hypothetical protein PLM53_15330 [Spirochaetota bacterium]|nr:hypothetical protein [Spirochaetota bacterium]HQF09653.1 hypothetical protein [Spirochaetota bacterium]HQH98469.1 hypothetical protein [Spirochaetota bacterium]HQJ73084.1 hypothetical protein [Spirochaetota bacterium]